MKEIIREEDIESVIMSDGSASCTYIKNKDGIDYKTLYSYDNLEEGTTYCSSCGTIYDKHKNDICPTCKGENIDILPYTDMPDLIMNMINDHVRVAITLKNDPDIHVFYIPEKVD